MPIFYYTALDQADAFTKGQIEARHRKAARAKLEGEGFVIVNIKQEKIQRWWNTNFWQSISALDRIFFTRNLHTLVGAGISLDQAVNITAEQTTNDKLRPILEDIALNLRRGQTFHSVLNRYPNVFGRFFIDLVRVGEISGKLDETLGYLLEEQERDYDLRTKARGAMIYPIIILCALVIMVTFMLAFVIPRVAGVLDQYQVQLPLATRILLALSSFITSYGFYTLPVLVALVYGYVRWHRTVPGRRLVDGWLLKTPIVHRLIKEFNLARFTRSLSSLLKSGQSIDQALELCASTATNVHYQEALRGAIQFVRKGLPLGEVMKGNPKLFPPLTCRMVEVGERTGKLDDMTTRLAVFYEKSVSTSLENLSATIEPILILVVGLIVGFVAVSILTPVWKFSATI